LHAADVADVAGVVCAVDAVGIVGVADVEDVAEAAGVADVLDVTGVAIVRALLAVHSLRVFRTQVVALSENRFLIARKKAFFHIYRKIDSLLSWKPRYSYINQWNKESLFR